MPEGAIPDYCQCECRRFALGYRETTAASCALTGVPCSSEREGFVQWPTQRRPTKTHRRFFPLFHFTAIPLLVINLIVRIVYAIVHRGARLVWWEIAFAFALVCLALATRIMVLTVQDRLIRLEETTRLQGCLPDELRGRIGELSKGDLIALRFCGDEGELAGLTRSILDGKLKGREEIKKQIKTWRPDTMRA